MQAIDRLMLTVGLLDRITAPLRGIQRTVDQVTSHSRKAFMNTAAGVMTLIAASTSFANTISPANDMNNALGEVRSLEVAEDTLATLNQAGLKYSIQFGEQASTYVRSAYDIQSAIDGLVDNDLPRFTTAAGTLSKATKANITDITSYFGTMYGIFRNQANEIGKAEWIEMLAGQTATAVQMFKTTGPEMSAAFTSIGAEAQTMGVELSEQIAILGSLQSTMSGSEAGTKYRSFLTGLAGAQDKLSLNFTDQSGKLLPIVDVLNKIEGKFGQIDTLAESDVLKKAFGTSEAVAFLKLMSNDIGKLNGDIEKLAKVEGMQKAIWMAEQMNDPWARLASGIQAVSIAIWQKSLPVIEPYIDILRDATLTIVQWTDKYPYLTRAVGLGVTALIAFVAIGGLVALSVGLMQFAMAGLGMRFLLLKPLLWVVRSRMLLLQKAMWLLRTAMLAYMLYGPAVMAFFTMLKTAILTTLPAIYSFTAALLANPITWIVVGVVALIAALVALVVYWDDVTAALGRFVDFVFGAVSNGWKTLRTLFENNAFLKVAFWPLYAAIEIVDAVIDGFKRLPLWWSEFSDWLGGVSLMPVWELGMDAFEQVKSWWSEFSGWLGNVSLMPVWGFGLDAFEQVKSWWSEFSDWLGGVSLMPVWELGMDVFEQVKAWWSEFKEWLSALNPFAFLVDSLDSLKVQLSWIPGLDFADQDVVQRSEDVKSEINSMVTLPGAEPVSSAESGGLMQSISNWFGASSKSTTVEKIEVHNHGQGVRGDVLAHELEMAAG